MVEVDFMVTNFKQKRMSLWGIGFYRSCHHFTCTLSLRELLMVGFIKSMYYSTVKIKVTLL